MFRTRPLRSILVIGVSAAISLLTGGHIFGANLRSFNINAWSGGPVVDAQTKHFDHCAATSSNDDGVSIGYEVDREYQWHFLFSSAKWDFTSGGSFYLTLRLNDRPLPGQRGLIRGNQTLLVEPSDGINVTDAFRIGGNLRVAIGGTVLNFEIRDTNDVMDVLVQCVAQELHQPVRPKTYQMVRSVPSSRLPQKVSPPVNANIAEATALADNIIASAEIKDAQMLPLTEFAADPTIKAGWKSGPLTVTISMLLGEFTKLNDVALSLINYELRICQNQLFVATAADTLDRSPIKRVLTICRSPEAAASKYRVVVPRPKGGYYVLTTLIQGVEFTAAPDRPATDMDRKLRAFVMSAISKMDPTTGSSNNQQDDSRDGKSAN